MEKSCRTCKWYYNEKCTKRDDIFKTEVCGEQSYSESGQLMEYIRDSLMHQCLYKTYFDELSKRRYMKKKLPKDLNKDLTQEELEADFNELLEDYIAEIIPIAAKEIETDIYVKSPESYYCSNWE